MKQTLNANAQVVLGAVREATNHPTALEVYEMVKRTRPRIGLASVYRILHALSEQGYIKELGRNEEGYRYDGETARHDHAICTRCGTLLDVPLEIVLSEKLLQDAAQAAGIDLQFHEVRLYGLCPTCRQTNR